MSALDRDRNTPNRTGLTKAGGMATNVTLFAGAIVMRNANGYLTKGQTALNLVGVGRSPRQQTNSGGNGAVVAEAETGIYRFTNSSAGDTITIADIGNPAYAVDDQTVAKTSGTNTRSIAGFIFDVDDVGVWVEFDEAKVRSYLAGITLPA